MDAAAELGRNPASARFSLEHGDEQADARWDCRTRLARPNSQARKGTGNSSFIFPVQLGDHEQDLATLPGGDGHTYKHSNSSTYIPL